MMQVSAYPGHQRPLFEEVQQLSDAQLSIMCHNYRIFPGPITFQTRRQAERQLHIALIDERARIRARQQFAEESRLRFSENTVHPPNPPPQEHFDFRAIVPQPAAISGNYWPKARTATWRTNPPPSSSFRYREQLQAPVLEPRRYTTWQQQNRFHQPAEVKPEANEVSILGFKLPFTLETAREITTKIGDTLKRFQGVGEAQEDSRFQGGSIKRGQVNHQEESEDEYQAANSQNEDVEFSDEDFSYPGSQDTLFDPEEAERKPQQAYAHPLPYDFRELRTLADAEAQTELMEHPSSISTTTTYYDFSSQEPMRRATTYFSRWWPRRVTAGDEQIPAAEQTRVKEHRHEHEVTSIDYRRQETPRDDGMLEMMSQLRDDYPGQPTPRANDGMLELMGRVDLRDDSEEEELVILPNGRTRTQPSRGTYAGFGRLIFRLLCCDRNGNLDAEKLCCTFFSCCLAMGIYMGFRMMR